MISFIMKSIVSASVVISGIVDPAVVNRSEYAALSYGLDPCTSHTPILNEAAVNFLMLGTPAIQSLGLGCATNREL
jgi:hypothetical protein